jgi:hypothetical protein
LKDLIIEFVLPLPKVLRPLAHFTDIIGLMALIMLSSAGAVRGASMTRAYRPKTKHVIPIVMAGIIIIYEAIVYYTISLSRGWP